MSASQLASIKIINSEQLTSQYIQKLERQKFRAVALLLFLVTLSFVSLCFHREDSPDPDILAIFANGMYTLTSCVAAWWAFSVTYRASRPPLILASHHRLAWFLIGLGLLINGLANVYYGYAQYILQQEPAAPSFADLGYILTYVLVLAGLLLFPFQTQSRRIRARIAIDSLITTLCLLGVSWYLIINPIVTQSPSNEFFETFINVSYPCLDLLLMLAIILFIHRDAPLILRPSLWICGFGVLAQVWADSGYAYLTHTGQYRSGLPGIDPFWFLGYLLIGLSALFQYSSIARQTYREQVLAAEQKSKPSPPLDNQQVASQRFVILQSAILYLPFLGLLILTLTSQVRNNFMFGSMLNFLCMLVLLLILVHFALVSYENLRLIREKEQNMAEAELLHKATVSLSNVLEIDPLLNHIVTIAANELGFNAAALVVIEEYDRSLDEQSSLQARATTSKAGHVMFWRVRGKMVPYCTALMGKNIEVMWSEAPAHAPTMVHQWHAKQHIQSSLFVPLAYQGKIQGSLAFSLQEARHFSKRESYLANAFAAEAANAIEHAHLYERAREHASFAQAMANVAARLNSVVATGLGTGSEIHHLICTEGANAMRADLAILYGYNPDGLLTPLAALTGDPEPTTLPQEWPPLSFSDYFMQLCNSRQPALIQVAQQVSSSKQKGSKFLTWPSETETFSPEQNGHTPISASFSGHVMSSFQISPSSHAFPGTSSNGTAVQAQPQPYTSLQSALQRRFVHTAILAPLIIHQNPIGLLILARTHRPGTPLKRSFISQDLAHAHDFASQASIAFTNARLYQQLHNAHQRMQELDQLKDQFMVTASHELRTPLTAVQGYLELLEQYHTTISSDQQAEFLQKASRGCEELVLLLNNV
ncbi:MAG TPA: GAF domain-containing protein, partial [Ktedonobacteraceae bacterium]|nr:GAF domain-containing protein [Ktedonobacteraceae bacterium]